MWVEFHRLNRSTSDGYLPNRSRNLEHIHNYNDYPSDIELDYEALYDRSISNANSRQLSNKHDANESKTNSNNDECKFQLSSPNSSTKPNIYECVQIYNAKANVYSNDVSNPTTTSNDPKSNTSDNTNYNHGTTKYATSSPIKFWDAILLNESNQNNQLPLGYQH